MVIRVRLGLGVGVVMTGILLSDSLDPWLTLTLLSVFDIPRNTAIKSEKLKSLQAIIEDHLIESENIFVFKVPLVGTLNLCLRLPDNMQKTKI